MRLIDVDALRADYGMAEDCKNCKTGYRSCEYDRIYSKMDFCEWLDDAPTVDAVPVVHGRWIRVYSRPGVFKYLGWTCDQCGQRTGNEYAPQWYKFCPNCGARMDGKETP